MSKKDWKKVKAPTFWRPCEVGDTLTGTFAGLVQCAGKYGPYLAVSMQTEKCGQVYVTGIKAVSLAQWARPVAGETELKYVFKGYVECGDEHEMKDYELFTR